MREAIQFFDYWLWTTQRWWDEGEAFLFSRRWWDSDLPTRWKMKRIHENISILHYLSKLKLTEQKLLISGAPKELLFCLSEIALNLIHRNIQLSPLQIKKLKKFERQIIDLTAKKHSLVKRRTILKKGSFIKHFLDATLPSLMTKVIKKNDRQ